MADDIAREDLPLPDFDHLPLGTLKQRVRSLEADDVAVLREYEETRANRLPVLVVLDQWLTELADGAAPSGGDPASPAPELAPPPEGPVTASPQTQGPPQNPPSHGDPTNPAQPRT
ncbi:MAG: hypothetical protein IR158_15105 [Cellulomonas sp.]|jgi:hypothetical protein|uniref:hypothetical protein n=1 Tax=Cellulomonas sp. TaxID=40001 RepID=UPI0019F18EE9|nr:hypothetical protein [Cellulomonas sp.]MBF0689080.1 hypothetical protein [Cellulomonas sp.]